MKTSKEAIVGLVAALEAFVSSPCSTTYPGEVNKVARVLAAKLQTLSVSMDVSSLMDVSILTGIEAGVTDVQPSAHLLVFINIKNLVFFLFFLFMVFVMVFGFVYGFFYGFFTVSLFVCLKLSWSRCAACVTMAVFTCDFCQAVYIISKGTYSFCRIIMRQQRRKPQRMVQE